MKILRTIGIAIVSLFVGIIVFYLYFKALDVIELTIWPAIDKALSSFWRYVYQSYHNWRTRRWTAELRRMYEK